MYKQNQVLFDREAPPPPPPTPEYETAKTVRHKINKKTSSTSDNVRLRSRGPGLDRHSYFIGRCEQVVGHFLEVGRLAGVDEAHHLFEDIGVHVADVNTVLGRSSRY